MPRRIVIEEHLRWSGSARVLLFVLGLAAVQFTLQICVLTKGVSYIVSVLTNDDTYYYLQSAWNTARLGFVTFDGIHPTNGVQLLWFGLVVILANFSSSTTHLLWTALTLCFLLNVSCYVVIWRLGTILNRPGLSLLMVSLWSLVCFSDSLYSRGMENSLHALVFWCVVLEVTKFLIQAGERDRPAFVRLTIVLILNSWTRLDSALFSAVLYVYCIAVWIATARSRRLFWQRNLAAIVTSIALGSLGLVIQFATFWLMAGSALPVSALVKASTGGWRWDEASLPRLIEILTWSIPLSHAVFPPIVFRLLGFVGVLAVIGGRLLKPQGRPKELVAFQRLWYCLLGAMLLYHVLVVASGVKHAHYFTWYRSPMFIFWIVTVSLAAYMGEYLAVLKGFPTAFRRAVVALSLLLVATSGVWFAERIRRTTTSGNNLHYIRYHAALWMGKNLAPDAICASWNAGEIAYFSGRTVINLDGLMNSPEYYERFIKGARPLVEYLHENRVRFIVDYKETEITSGWPVVAAFAPDEATGKWLRIWEVPAPLSQD